METAADPVKWIERNFYIPETRDDPKLRGRIQLQQYQKDALYEALSKDENGLYKYSIIVWSDIKKSAKSTIAAAVNLSRAWYTEWGEFYVIANDLKQADSRVAHYLRRAIQLNEEFRKKTRSVGYRTTLPNGSFIEAVPIDPSGEAGSNADMITFSELWGANEKEKQRMWSEMTLSPTKHGKAFRWIESYAGFSGESELLYSLYELGVKKGELLWPDRLYPVTESEPSPLELYVNHEARMLCLWNTQPRCPWQTKEYYKSEEATLAPNEFLRMHRNQWVSSTETFAPMAWWDACRHEEGEWPKWGTKYGDNEFIQKKWPMVIALDAGVSDDNFGLWMGCRHPKFKDEVLTWTIKRWQPEPGKKIDFEGSDENPGPEKFLLQLIKDYNVVQVCYDPYQLHYFATRLNKLGLAWFKSFSQGTDRLLADSQIRELIRDRKIWHRGEPDLREHVQNADAKIDTEDHKVRIVKRADKLKVDLLVTMSMGSYEILRLNL